MKYWLDQDILKMEIMTYLYFIQQYSLDWWKSPFIYFSPEIDQSIFNIILCHGCIGL